MRCLEQALPSLQPRSPERLTGGKHQSQAGRIRSAGQTQPDKGLSSRNLLRPSPEYLIFATHIVSMVVAVGHISHTQRNPANSSTTASFLSYCYQSGNLLVAGLSCACPVNPVSLIQSRELSSLLPPYRVAFNGQRAFAFGFGFLFFSCCFPVLVNGAT